MKIALFNDSFPPTMDGVANAVKSYADILTENGHEVVVITPKYPNVEDDYPYEVYRYSSLKFKGKMPYRVGNCFSPKAIKDLHSMHFDIFHVHAPFSSAILAKSINMGRKDKVPVVFTYHTKYDIEINKYIKIDAVEKVANKFVLSNIKACDEIWTVTDGAGKWLKKIGFKGDYTVMPNGTDFPKGRAEDKNVEKLKNRLEIGDEKVILFVGRILWHKNIKLILDTVKKLQLTDLKFKMLFVGDGVDRLAVEEYAKKTEVYDSCIFTGAVYDREKLREYFTLADIFFFPSTFDTSGLVVKEAAACKLPSLLIRGSCAQEGAEDGISCITAEENSDDCADKIYHTLTDEKLLKSLGDRACEKVYYSWKDSVEDAIKGYEKVIENFKAGKYKKKR